MIKEIKCFTQFQQNTSKCISIPLPNLFSNFSQSIDTTSFTTKNQSASNEDILVLSKKEYNCSYMIFSKKLLIAGNIEIGPELLIFVMSPYVC